MDARDLPDLAGLRVLVVEDTLLIAETIEDELRECGCDIIGPVSRVQPALELVGNGERIDGALLDVNLAGEYCFPIAVALAARRIPFIFLTGYGGDAILPEFRDRPRLTKPFTHRDMTGLIRANFRAGGGIR